MPPASADTLIVADVFLYLLWIAAAALVYAVLIAAVHARRRRPTQLPGDLETQNPDSARGAIEP